MLSGQIRNPKLAQARAAEAFQIVLPVGVLLDRHLAAIQASEMLGCARRSSCNAALAMSSARHAGGSGQHAVGADEIAALTDRLARQPHRLIIIASDELGVGGDAAIDRRKRIARTQPQTRGARPARPPPSGRNRTAPGRNSPGPTRSSD